jgi:acetylornithine deacetylase/succinyl-diaminopimelate desuccinylase-like protein
MIPGILDDVAEPARAEIESWKQLPFDEKEFLAKEVGSKALTGVHGIAGGFTGAGAKTVIPARATAKVSFRLVPNQTPEQVAQAFRSFVAANTPTGCTMEVKVLSGAPATVVDPGHPAIATAAQAFQDVMGRPTVFTRSGGSIPIVGEFAKHLGIPTVLMGFGLPDDGLHSPNEKFKVANYYTGIVTVAHFLELYGRS